MMANEHNIIYADAWLIHALALVGATMHDQGMKLKMLPAHDVQRAWNFCQLDLLPFFASACLRP
jgi:hypothetical protein